MQHDSIKIVCLALCATLQAQHVDYSKMSSTIRAKTYLRPKPGLEKYCIKLHQNDTHQWISITNQKNISIFIPISDFEKLGNMHDGYLSSIFEFGDYNFDGYIDFAIESFCGATGNDGHMYFLFHCEDMTFKLHNDWSELSWATFFPASKKIRTHWNIGNAGENRSESWYQVDGYKLVLIDVTEYKNNNKIKNY